MAARRCCERRKRRWRRTLVGLNSDHFAWKKGHKYLTLVYQIDHGRRRLLHIAKDRTAASFGKFFDIRFVIAGMLPFVLLTAAGLVAVGDAIAALVHGRKAVAGVTTAALTLCLAVDSLAGYRTYRGTTLSCSEFWETPGLMERDGGFCRDRIMLNTFYPDHAFLLRPVGLPARAGSPIVGHR